MADNFEIPQSEKMITLLHNIITHWTKYEWDMGKIGNYVVERVYSTETLD